MKLFQSLINCFFDFPDQSKDVKKKKEDPKRTYAPPERCSQPRPGNSIDSLNFNLGMSLLKVTQK